MSIKLISRLRGWIGLLSLIGLVVGCDAAEPTPDKIGAPVSSLSHTDVAKNTIRIYASLPLSGGDKAYYQSMVNGFELALADFTGDSGKIGDFKLDLVIMDDANPVKGQWDANQEKLNALRAGGDPEAMLYLGPSNSGAAQVSIPLLNGAGLAMITGDATYSGLTKTVAGLTRQDEPARYYPNKTRNFFRLIAPDDLQGPAIVNFLKTLPAKRVFVIDDSQVYGRSLATSVGEACQKAQLDCTHRTSLTGTESDYKALASLVKTYSPDALFFGGIPEQHFYSLLSDLRGAGISAPLIGGDAIHTTNLLKPGDPNAENLYSVYPGLPEEQMSVKGQEIWQRYQARYGVAEYPIPLVGYEVMLVGLNAIKTAGVKERQAVLQAVANTRNFDGLRNKWSFDANGDSSLTDFTVLRAINGKWQYYTIVQSK